MNHCEKDKEEIRKTNRQSQGESKVRISVKKPPQLKCGGSIMTNYEDTLNKISP